MLGGFHSPIGKMPLRQPAHSAKQVRHPKGWRAFFALACITCLSAGCPRGLQMPIFSFAYPDGKGGECAKLESEFSTPEVARAEALRSAKDLYDETIDAGRQPEGWAVRVRDKDGKQICEISFYDVKGMAIASPI